MTEHIKVLALRLLDGFDQHISANVRLFYFYHKILGIRYYSGAEGPVGFTGLHVAAFFGIMVIAASLLDLKELDPNAPDLTGNTVLTWAAGRGRDEIVKMLLERRDVNPDQADAKYGRTPLSWAAGNGYLEVVKILLQRGDVSPDQADAKYSQTPLL